MGTSCGRRLLEPVSALYSFSQCDPGSLTLFHWAHEVKTVSPIMRKHYLPFPPSFSDECLMEFPEDACDLTTDWKQKQIWDSRFAEMKNNCLLLTVFFVLEKEMLFFIRILACNRFVVLLTNEYFKILVNCVVISRILSKWNNVRSLLGLAFFTPHHSLEIIPGCV